jgi:RNA polymerase-binding transcription factor DksA
VDKKEKTTSKEEERQRRLAEMMSNADSMDRERETRIDASLREDAELEKREQATRLERGRYGTGRDFIR